MSYANLQAALDNHLQTLANLPPLQLENTRNIGRTGQSFSRATLLPARPSQLSVGAQGRDLRRGLYQIDLFVPTDDGATTANVMADEVIAHFPRGLVVSLDGTSVVVEMAYREVGQRVETFYMLPIMVVWWSIA
jgi:hypothetical protein